jgi:hypothetical protein
MLKIYKKESLMKKYIGLLILCVLTGIAMERDVQEEQKEKQITLFTSDGGTIEISSDIAGKIPTISAAINKDSLSEEAKTYEIRFLFNTSILQIIIDTVKDVYRAAPVLNFDPQFFTETDQHQAFTPADIPQQVRGIIHEKIRDLQLSECKQTADSLGFVWDESANANKQQQNVCKQVADFLRIDWNESARVSKQQLSVCKQAADFLGLDWIVSTIDNPESKSIADLVVFNALPDLRGPFNPMQLDVSNHALVSCAGMYLIDKETLQRIQYLNLDKNNISSIAPINFAGMQNLKILSLSHNQIRDIEQKDFDGLQNLEDLSLSNNQIRTIAPKSFVKLQNLEDLDLSSNQLWNISEDAFAGLQNLGRLDLSKNQIQNITERTFAGLQSLRLLNLFENNICNIAQRAFANLRNLECLWVDDYYIDSAGDVQRILPPDRSTACTLL